MRVDELKPAPGSSKPRAPGRAGHRRARRQDGRPGHEGPEGPQHGPRGFEGGQMPMKQTGAEAEGLQQPVPHRVPGHQPGRARGQRLTEVTPEPSTRTA
jgi:hypothetical protein